MKRIFKGVISMLLVITLLFGATVPVFAAQTGEEYVSDLRIVYADDYEEAREILDDTNFRDYILFNENLNEGSGEDGVWLAYKTTTNINDAITDMAVIQENGGYVEGNYEEMIKESLEEYTRLSEIYLEAIDYFVEAYDADDFLAKCAYRQLNFFTIKTIGLTEKDKPDFEGELLGDIFYDGIDESELATIFMEGNSYVLQNVRSLLAMGVSYNEDGETYLQKVANAAAAMTDDPRVFDNEDYDELAANIAGTILTFRDMFKELKSVESTLDYTDDVVTDEELSYSEYYSFAERMRETDYLDGKTLYDFCLEYKLDDEDLSPLYPLVAALNEGQVAMTEVFHYYDVVNYSMTDYPEDIMDEEITKLEETYSLCPFNVYEGVDRTMFKGSYALTAEAYRADSYNEEGFSDWLWGSYPQFGATMVALSSAGVVMSVWAICRTVKANMMTNAAKAAVLKAQTAYSNVLNTTLRVTGGRDFASTFSYPYFDGLTSSTMENVGDLTFNDVINSMFDKYVVTPDPTGHLATSNLNMVEKIAAINSKGGLSSFDQTALQEINDNISQYANTLTAKKQAALAKAQAKSASTAQTVSNMSSLTASLYIMGGILMLVSAITLGVSIICYYNPDYDEIPIAMVDLIKTVDGDRYIKYDAVLEAEARSKGNYIAADLNAYEGQHWNALYYTKSYEAGKPLLADSFEVSNKSNQPKDGYLAVHRFGEVVCYDMNRYNFDDDRSIYLSVKQSENQKTAVAGVPEVVGSVFGTGFLVLAGGIGAIAGIGGTLATQSIIAKKKEKVAKKENE